MIQTTIQAAQENLPQLLERVQNGEVIIIEQDGKALARIVAVETLSGESESDPNWFGSDAGKGWIAPDFDETSEEFIKAFYGEGE